MRVLLTFLLGAVALPVFATCPAWAEADVLRATLPNGLRVVIVQDTLAPVVTTEINYLAGSVDAPKGFPGTAHALEHMMFRGSRGLDKDQLSEVASLIGGEYNADTTETVTQFFYTAPAEDLDVMLRIESLRMNGAMIDQADWNKERGAIEQEVSRDNSSPVYKYLAQVQSILFAGTPYAHDALGTRSSFDKTDATLLRGFYDAWYAPNNAILVIAGNVDPPAALKLVTERFGNLPRKALPAHPPIDLQPVKAQTLSFPTDLPIGIATLAFRMPGLQSKDFAAAQILSDAIGSERAALYGLVVSGQSLVSQFVYQPKALAGFAVAAGGFPKGGDPQPLLDHMRGVLADIAAHGVDPDLVAAAKRQEIAQLAFQKTDISGLASAWSNALAFQNLDSPDDLKNAFESVTTGEVNALAKQLLAPANMITAILTPRDSGAPGGGRGFGGAESFASAPNHPVALPVWAEAALNRLAVPDFGPAPVVTVLPNGLRLVVRQETVAPTVSVYGSIREEPALQDPPGKEGLASLTDQLFDYGTEKHDRLGFQKALDDIAASESAGASFQLKVPSANFHAGLQLLGENMLQPAFPAQAFSVVQRQQEQSLAGLLHSPDYLFGRAAEKAIVPAADPTLREATPQTVAALTLSDVQQFYRQAFRPDLTTIVIVGDVAPDRARQEVEDVFGAWTASGRKPNVDLPKIPDSDGSTARVPDSSAVQDTVVLTESIGLSAQNPARYDLLLGNTILGGGFSSRLYNDLRVHGGLVYSVDSSFDFGRTRASYGISFGADPDKVNQAVSLAVRDLAALQTTPVSAAELTRAKAEMLRRLPLTRGSEDGIAAQDLHLLDLDLPLDQPRLAANAYYNATADGIRTAFSTWVRPNDLARVMKGPAVTQ